MKTNLLRAVLLLVVICTLNSCSPEVTMDTANLHVVENYDYNTTELEAMDLINDYRVSVGLNPLEKINHVSYKSDEHNNYMITNKVVNHNDFLARSGNIMKLLGAKNVAENIAYNYNTPQKALEAWLNSPGHKENILGNFTHFGIGIKADPENGRKYYTNIFVKI
ncbi:CAP domain-containing protein [Flavobacterium sp. W1B]|uniref:CAP domain-containing protein n=1 Tax=Flavobacterium sp. W1B TaxID=3394146 RepID=UPI0039BC5959